MAKISTFVLFTLMCAANCLPLETSDLDNESLSMQAPVETERKIENLSVPAHRIQRRFINPLFSLGMPDTDNMIKMRTKRSYDECEKLQLCKLHARSRQSFFAAFELYFVNKENARLWDHRARSMADCEQRFGNCYNK